MTYDYQDADGYERGDMGKGKPKVKRIYKLDRIDRSTGMTYVKSCDAWGSPISEVFPSHTIKPLEKEIVR
jgi:hypothetical protein